MIKNFAQFNEAAGYSRQQFDFENRIEEKQVTIYGGDKFVEGSDDTEHSHFYVNWGVELAVEKTGIFAITPVIQKIAGTIEFVVWGDNDDDEILETVEFVGEGSKFKIKDQEFTVEWNCEFQNDGQYSVYEIEIDLQKKKVILS